MKLLPLFLAGAILILATACLDKHDRALEAVVHSSLQTATQHHDSLTFRLDTLTDFAWDPFFVVHPYTDPNRLEEAMDIDLMKLTFSGIKPTDHCSLLVFVNGRKVGDYTKQPITAGSLSISTFETGRLFARNQLLQITNGMCRLTNGVNIAT